MEVEVRCYAGFKGEERPLSIVLEGRTLEVLEVERSWREEDRSAPEPRLKDCFLVRADDGDAYVLRRDLADGRWEVEREAGCHGSGCGCGACCGAGHVPGYRETTARCRIDIRCFDDKGLTRCADCPDYENCDTVLDLFAEDSCEYERGYAEFLEAAHAWKAAYGKLP